MEDKLFEDLKDDVKSTNKRPDYLNGYINALLDYQVIFPGQHSILSDIINI